MNVPETSHCTNTHLSYKSTYATAWVFSSSQWRQYLKFTFLMRVKNVFSVHNIHYGYLLSSSYLWGKNLQSWHAVVVLQALMPRRAGIYENISTEKSTKFGELWFSVHLIAFLVECNVPVVIVLCTSEIPSTETWSSLNCGLSRVHPVSSHFINKLRTFFWGT